MSVTVNHVVDVLIYVAAECYLAGFPVDEACDWSEYEGGGRLHQTIKCKCLACSNIDCQVVHMYMDQDLPISPGDTNLVMEDRQAAPTSPILERVKVAQILPGSISHL